MGPISRTAEAFYNFITGFATFYRVAEVLARWKKEYDTTVAVAQSDN
jgi:hypothetical protein